MSKFELYFLAMCVHHPHEGHDALVRPNRDRACWSSFDKCDRKSSVYPSDTFSSEYQFYCSKNTGCVLRDISVHISGSARTLHLQPLADGIQRIYYCF